MIDRIRQLLRPKRDFPLVRLPDGERVYAIGDIHGRLDLLTKIAKAIEDDDAARGEADTTIILLGDLIDRGPDSAAVVEMAREWSRRRKVRILAGNHEEMFLLGFYKLNAFKNFLRMGGVETILSYEVDRDRFRAADLEEAQQMMIEAVPVEDREFLHGFEDMIRIGDYLFVHAGIDPEVPLDEQASHDCRWIREPFLSHKEDFGCMVVHGHTVTGEAVLRHNRIGIDTGAFVSGKLTAIGLEGSERWLIQAQEDGGSIETFARAA
jgi:serine/threonine protein phosphatase 1